MKVKVSELRIVKTRYDHIFLDQYLLENGKENRTIPNIPHYKLLCAYDSEPTLDLANTDYFRFATAQMAYFGHWFGRKGESGVLLKEKMFLELYQEVRRNGFDGNSARMRLFKADPNRLDDGIGDESGRPHPRTATYFPEGYEIIDGHHRAAILAKLGVQQVEVELCAWRDGKWVRENG
jgi:hypothetical protein